MFGEGRCRLRLQRDKRAPVGGAVAGAVPFLRFFFLHFFFGAGVIAGVSVAAACNAVAAAAESVNGAARVKGEGDSRGPGGGKGRLKNTPWSSCPACASSSEPVL